MAKQSIIMAVLAGGLLTPMAVAQDPPQGGAAQQGGGRGGRAGRGGAGGGFPQQTRQLAAPDVIARGRAVYGVNCAACHGGDLRGGDQGGPSLLRSLVALSDQHGETAFADHSRRAPGQGHARL